MKELKAKHSTESSLTQKALDTVSRQAAIDAFGLSEKTRKYGGDHSGYDTRMLYEIQNILEDLPSVQPERKKGKWLKEDRGHVEYTAVCDQCGFGWFWSEREDFKFCPGCGARMENAYEGSD